MEQENEMNSEKYAYKTTITNHKECMKALADKAGWEEMTRLAVLAE